MAGTATRIRAVPPRTVRAAAQAFLDTIGSPNTRRAYTIAVVKTADRLDSFGPDGLLAPSRPLAEVTDAEIGAALEALWGEAAVNTWNARRAAVGKWLSWCAEQGWDAPRLPASAARSTPPDSQTPVRSRTAIDRLIGRREVHVREKTLWRMLYETCARAEELLQANIEDLDLAGRSCPVKSKGAKPRTRRRGAAHHEHVLETVYWGAGTARLLPRLIKDRTAGPLFVTHRRPGPGKYLADRDVCPDTGLARLSYDQARDLLDAATATDGPGTGWDLHELRHSGLTHLGESGASLLELMAKSRHRKAENLRRYFTPSPQAMRDLTALLGPGADRQR
ncbi:tyrosine-type recombinase/integrase [Nocardia sp. NPDC004151]|uniref:tyrosine-type recombinase/integrase n=1 Tax=Nocardia sp. NPDC004151 TaxID=3364304 RepID=UPI0036CB5C8D